MEPSRLSKRVSYTVSTCYEHGVTPSYAMRHIWRSHIAQSRAIAWMAMTRAAVVRGCSGRRHLPLWACACVAGGRAEAKRSHDQDEPIDDKPYAEGHDERDQRK